jgi:hypothetical protein
MSGAAYEVGQGALVGALTGILGALDTGAGEPTREPTPTPPSLARPTMILGLPIATVVLLGLGTFLVMRLAK